MHFKGTKVKQGVESNSYFTEVIHILNFGKQTTPQYSLIEHTEF